MRWRGMPALCLVACAAGCGVSGQKGQNTVPVVVNSGPPGIGYVNGVFTTVTVCVPGTSQCQDIPYTLVDTGSAGLRVLHAAAGGVLSLSLPQQNASGLPLLECGAFVDGYVWGPVRRADIQIGAEKASSVPIQVIGGPGLPAVPASCSGNGGAEENSQEALSANAILGVGSFPQDCGADCEASPDLPHSPNPGNVYYTCTSAGCQGAAVGVDAQVQNPVSKLAVDNNGVVLQLPAVPPNGAPSIHGTLIFGIGTQPNNGLGGATVLTADPGIGSFTTSYMGQSYPKSYIDSGSNAIYFLDQKLSQLPVCTAQDTSGLYCPATSGSVALSAVNIGVSGTRSTVGFNVANGDTLEAIPDNFVFNDLAGPSSGGEYFGWGLPFFLGRSVYTSIEGSRVPGGTAPYFAY